MIMIEIKLYTPFLNKNEKKVQPTRDLLAALQEIFHEEVPCSSQLPIHFLIILVNYRPLTLQNLYIDSSYPLS